MTERKLLSESEDRLLASLAHLGAFLPLAGLLLALILWITQQGRSALLRFQALQALLFQGIALALYYLAGFVLAGVYFVFFFPFILISESGGGEEAAWVVIPFLVIFFGMVVLMVLAAAGYYLLAALAAVNTLRGRDYRYPLVGRWTEKLTPRR